MSPTYPKWVPFRRAPAPLRLGRPTSSTQGVVPRTIAGRPRYALKLGHVHLLCAEHLFKSFPGRGRRRPAVPCCEDVSLGVCRRGIQAQRFERSRRCCSTSPGSSASTAAAIHLAGRRLGILSTARWRSCGATTWVSMFQSFNWCLAHRRENIALPRLARRRITGSRDRSGPRRCGHQDRGRHKPGEALWRATAWLVRDHGSWRCGKPTSCSRMNRPVRARYDQRNRLQLLRTATIRSSSDCGRRSRVAGLADRVLVCGMGASLLSACPDSKLVLEDHPSRGPTHDPPDLERPRHPHALKCGGGTLAVIAVGFVRALAGGLLKPGWPAGSIEGADERGLRGCQFRGAHALVVLRTNASLAVASRLCAVAFNRHAGLVGVVVLAQLAIVAVVGSIVGYSSRTLSPHLGLGVLVY